LHLSATAPPPSGGGAVLVPRPAWAYGRSAHELRLAGAALTGAAPAGSAPATGPEQGAGDLAAQHRPGGAQEALHRGLLEEAVVLLRGGLLGRCRALPAGRRRAVGRGGVGGLLGRGVLLGALLEDLVGGLVVHRRAVVLHERRGAGDLLQDLFTGGLHRALRCAHRRDRDGRRGAVLAHHGDDRLAGAERRDDLLEVVLRGGEGLRGGLERLRIV